MVKLILLGPGINKTEEYPCPKKPESVIVMGGTILITDRYYSDTRGELIHLESDKCEKEVFNFGKEDGKLRSEVRVLGLTLTFLLAFWCSLLILTIINLVGVVSPDTVVEAML